MHAVNTQLNQLDKVGHPFKRHLSAAPTRVVEQSLGFSPVLWWSDELPDEALDVLISTVVKEAEDQDDTADRLHITFAQPTLTPGVGQYVPPAPPTEEKQATE